ncbi:MAG: hypothetical protein PHP61_04065 [Candidatus Izemoplasmatales bacterium]|jgi:hypothetical protein|nr:hypothetical protein [Candidatus Izemoplasmatales bacterium]MDD4987467.1 hypothetical protein [Candidatus Izemoplasmatales bacterium]MDD5602276.1 hypothetical protein [Candidatus Izemoplasmatales bacterium]MDY0373381.1 hypothetical protein [Candidatus Izemoplasmatales bacterium]NLF48204.1 hypothetical protein [Acholeplasmataceae bacterium]
MKRITFITGYYGSGKTEISLNLAIQKQVNYLVDLDIINPYFRSREAEGFLKQKNIEIISSDLQNGAYADVPYLSKKIFMPFRQSDKTAIFDVGGNDLGAKVMRQFEQEYSSDIDLFVVANVYRDETHDGASILRMIREIEGASGFKVTGIINNSNLLRETTYDDILVGEAKIAGVAKKADIPIVFTSVYEELYDPTIPIAGEPLILKLYFRKNWY